jgi:cytochrome b subunit of formate dehydrogenase
MRLWRRQSANSSGRQASPPPDVAGLEARSAIAPAPAAPAERPLEREEYIRRFDIHQRLQHLGMMSSFLTLAVTGLPQKFSSLGVSQWGIARMGGVDTARDIHHIAAWVMLGVCVYHVLYLVARVLIAGDLGPLRMIPSLKDVQDAADTLLYFLGAKKEKPRYGRFSYLEKFDYWAVFWGIAIIGGSGLILLFPVQTAKILPGVVIPAARAAHSDEAVLAAGWIFIAHFFYAHFSPKYFPFNTTIFTGRMSRRKYKEEHPLEYAELEAKRRHAEQSEAGPGR